jgi:hypothetical protein
MIENNAPRKPQRPAKGLKKEASISITPKTRFCEKNRIA